MNTRARAIKSQAAAGRHDCTTVPGICTSDTTTVVTNTKEERHKEKPATVQSDTCSVSTNEKASEPEKIRVRLPFWLTSDYPRHKEDYRSSRARSSAVAFQLIFLGSPSSPIYLLVWARCKSPLHSSSLPTLPPPHLPTFDSVHASLEASMVVIHCGDRPPNGRSLCVDASYLSYHHHHRKYHYH